VTDAADPADAADRLERILRDKAATFSRPRPDAFVVQLPGEKRLKTACWLRLGEHSLAVEAFVMRAPDENAEQVHAWLLHHNAKLYGVSWSIDLTGDVYLTGRLPLAAVEADEIDRILGAVLDAADGSFNTLLELGFGSSIEREWQWRAKTGESLANLAAFAEFVHRRAGSPTHG
jgi:hypothetical protein